MTEGRSDDLLTGSFELDDGRVVQLRLYREVWNMLTWIKEERQDVYSELEGAVIVLAACALGIAESEIYTHVFNAYEECEAENL